MSNVAAGFPVLERPAESRTGPVEHAAWIRARRRVRLAMKASRVVLLIGAPGTGKSSLLADLATVLRGEGQTVTLIRHVGLEAPLDVGVLLLDEADRLSVDDLCRLCEAPARCVLAGLPELAETTRLFAPAAPVVVLEPMRADEVLAFAQAHLDRTEAPVRAMTPEAVAELAARSGGVARDITVLSGLAGFAAGGEGADCIGLNHVAAATWFRHGAEPPGPAAVLTALAAAAPTAGEATGLPVAYATATVSSPPRNSVPARGVRRRWPGAVIVVAAASLGVAGWILVPTIRTSPSPAETARPEPEPEVAAITPAAPGPAQAAAPSPPIEPQVAIAVDPLASLPVAAAARVRVVYPAVMPDGAERSRALVDRLAVAGLSAEVVPQPASGAPGVRYYYAEDADGAARVAAALDQPASLDPRPLHPAEAVPGRIDVQVASDPDLNQRTGVPHGR